MRDYILENIQESIAAKQKLLNDEGILKTIEEAASLCIDAYKKGRKILVCGNGGSASDALHMTGELVGRYKLERSGIPAIALNSNVAVMTALGNDYDYESIYAKQVKALGSEGDVLFAISTSGNSKNTVAACRQASAMNISTVSLTGENGGKMREISDICLNVPSNNTPRIQEMHILLIHTLCGIIEKQLYEDGYFEEA
ncbi:MAG: SIS domain-containing protein [Lachnospiraceae bacterium]